MKKLAFIFALMLLVSCGKQEPMVLSDFIVGTWKWERNSLTTYEYTNDGKQIVVYDFGSGISFSRDTFDYHVNDLLNTITITEYTHLEGGTIREDYYESLVIWSEDDRGVMIFQPLDGGDIYKYLRLD
jgi:hypothetical protein